MLQLICSPNFEFARTAAAGSLVHSPQDAESYVTKIGGCTVSFKRWGKSKERNRFLSFKAIIYSQSLRV
jgi:ABC-type uncharacterized transport system YnjBCD substrate-binding protein